MSENEKLEFKLELKSICIRVLEQRMKNAEQAIAQAQDAANSEDKSTAGDKHETGRAMGQLDQEMNARQLEASRKELELARQIPIDVLCSQVGNGAVVVCKEFSFFISAGLGAQQVQGQNVILLSPKAPIAGFLLRKKTGDTFSFNGKTVEIVDVF